MLSWLAVNPIVWIRNNPTEGMIAISASLFIVFIILGVVAHLKVSAAQKTGKVADKTWVNINVASYSVLAIIAFLFMVWACTRGDFSCFMMTRY